MRLKTTLILLGVVAVLALFVQFYEKKKPSTDEWQLQAKKVFLKFNPDRVNKLEIKRDDGLVVLERTDKERWDMKKPLELRADQSEINSILTELEFLTKVGSIEAEKGKTLDLASYGLEKPKIVASYWTGPADKQTFFVGETRAGGSEVYMKLEDSEDVYMVSGALLKKLTRTLNELRSKNVLLDIDPNAVERVELKYASGEVIECAKSGGNWKVVRPVVDRGDNEKVMQVIYNLNALVIDKNDFITDDPKDLSTFGLDNPQIAVTVHQKGISQGVLLGHTRDNKVYAKRVEGSSVFFLKEMTTRLFKKNPTELRAKKLVAALDPLYVTNCEIKTKDQTIKIEKTKQYDYMITEPVRVLADRDVFKGFLETIKQMEIQNFVDDAPKDLSVYGLQEPAAEITITVKDKEPVRLQVGKKDERGALCYVKRTGEESVFSVKTGKFHGPATKGYLAFRDRLILEFNRDKARKVVIDRKDLRFVVSRAEGQTEKWELSEPVKVEADDELINNIVWSLSFLKAEAHEAESPKDLEPYGLDSPRIKTTIYYEKEAPTEEKPEGEDLFLAEKGVKKGEIVSKTLLIGNKIQEGVNVDSYAMMEDGSLVFHMSWTDVRYLESDLASKVVARFDSNTVNKLHLNFPDKEIVYEKKAEIWETLKPEKKQVVSKEVDSILYSLKNLKADSIAEYKTTDLAKYGLDKPQITITLNDEAGEKVLIMNRPAEGRPYFAKASNSDFIYVVSNTNVQKLIKGQAIVDLRPPEPSVGGVYSPPTGGGHGSSKYTPRGGHGY
ncbi:MAG: DUF4340 domain-containing protein [Candidatus Brocadiales bacterium]